MRQVRAKFRCLSITHHWDHQITAKLAPVMDKKGNHYEENRRFWECTPSGELELVYFYECPLKQGDYYYLDLTPSEGDNPWTLDSIRLSECNQGEVVFTWYRHMPDGWDYKQPKPPGCHRGHFEMTIEQNKTAAMEVFDKPGSKWELEVTLAAPSDD